MKLHLGCGKRNFGPEWVHIDKENFDHVKYNDVTKLPFENGSIDLIYACHLISYFTSDELLKILFEWSRVLKKGGRLRIATPDLETLLNIAGSGQMASTFGPIYGVMKSGNELIHHKSHYSFLTLSMSLTLSGLRKIRKYDFRETEHAMFDDHSKAHYPHDEGAIKSGVFTDNHIPVSLNMEATK